MAFEDDPVGLVETIDGVLRRSFGVDPVRDHDEVCALATTGYVVSCWRNSVLDDVYSGGFVSRVDLRHGAASLSLAAGNELKIVQVMLGHSSIVFTADTYVSVEPCIAHKAAEATATLVLRAARRDSLRIRGVRPKRRRGKYRPRAVTKAQKASAHAA